MQVDPEQPAPTVAGHFGDRFPNESDMLRNPSPYPPPVYQLSPEGTCFSDNVSPPPYDACLNYNAPAHGYAEPTESHCELPNYHSLHLNITGLVVSAQPPVIIAQPAPVVTSQPTYLGWSMFNCLCCFWPLGLAAIIYSVKVDSARNREEAKRHSLTARNLNIAATTIAPILVIVVVGAVLGSPAATGSARSNSGYTASTTSSVSSSSYSPSYYAKAYYYSYGYGYYYTYLMYYTYYYTYSYLAYSSYYNKYYGYTSYNSYSATGYQSATASQYTTDYNYQYAQEVDYYYSG